MLVRFSFRSRLLLNFLSISHKAVKTGSISTKVLNIDDFLSMSNHVLQHILRIEILFYEYFPTLYLPSPGAIGQESPLRG